MWVLTIWILPQKLEVANRVVLPDLLWKVKLILLPFTLNLDWRIYLIERRYILMLEIQYTSYNFNIVTLIVPFLELKILCSIRIVPKATINSNAFEFAVSTQL